MDIENGWNIDICFCIETTNNMAPVIDNLKYAVKRIVADIIDRMEETCKLLGLLRIKVIEFKDFGCCTEPIVVHDFIEIGNKDNTGTNAFLEQVDGISCRGGYGYCNALEAIALALKSDWTTGETWRKRHCVVVFSNGKVHPIQLKKNVSNYPEEIPNNFGDLTAWWEGRVQPSESTYFHRVGRMVAFVPNEEPWIEAQTWNGFFPVFSDAGAGLSEIDFEIVFDSLFGDW